jgi:hypothetical protein
MFEALAAPFPADKVSWRVGTSNKKKVQRDTGNNSAKATKGQVLAYIDARDVMDRLDEVVGPENWQDRYTHVDKKTVCEIDIWVEGRGWVTKADGAGDSDIEAEKGALSDAFKRAAVRWGIGRYLYGMGNTWVELEPAGRSFKIKDSEKTKLRAALTRHTGISPKTSAAAKRDKDFDFFKAKIDAAEDMEALGAVGREIKEALPMMPAAMRDPLHDAYALRREELMEGAAEGIAA